MFTSRPSESRTVLLWGNRWWLPGTGESCEFPSLAQAAEVLAEHLRDEPKPVRLRLIYQPDGFESVAVACPPGDRRLIGSALAAEYPQLASGEHAWGYDPVQPAGDGHETILHFEMEPALLALATKLAHLGLAVESAWPLATFLHGLPDDWTDSGAFTVLAVDGERAVAYRQPRNRPRRVQSWNGETVPMQVGQWLAAVLAEDADEPVLLVAPDPETAGALESYLGENKRGLESLQIGEALARPVVFPRYHPAQLIPRGPAFNAQQLAIAASIALFLAAGWAAFGFGRGWLAAQEEARNREIRLTALRTEVAHLRANAAEIQTLRARLKGDDAGPPFGDFLRALSRTNQPGVTVATLRLAGRSIEVGGWHSPDVTPAMLDRWRSRLASPDAAWNVALRSSANGAFTLTGAFQP